MKATAIVAKGRKAQSPAPAAQPPAAPPASPSPHEQAFMAGRDHAVALMREARRRHDGPTRDRSNVSSEYRKGELQDNFVLPFLSQLTANPAFDEGFAAVLSEVAYYACEQLDEDETAALTYDEIQGPWPGADTPKAQAPDPEAVAEEDDDPTRANGVPTANAFADEIDGVARLMLHVIYSMPEDTFEGTHACAQLRALTLRIQTLALTQSSLLLQAECGAEPVRTDGELRRVFHGEVAA